MLLTGLQSTETSSAIESHSNLCQLPAEIAVWFLHTACFIAILADDHPYMQLVSVLCKPVSIMLIPFLKVLSLYTMNSSVTSGLITNDRICCTAKKSCKTEKQFVSRKHVQKSTCGLLRHATCTQELGIVKSITIIGTFLIIGQIMLLIENYHMS